MVIALYGGVDLGMLIKGLWILPERLVEESSVDKVYSGRVGCQGGNCQLGRMCMKMTINVWYLSSADRKLSTVVSGCN